MKTTTPDIACNYYLGETCCVLPWKHDGDHQPADVVIVDRDLRPLNGHRVVKLGVRSRRIANARSHDYKGKASVSLSWLRTHVISKQLVNRPAVRVGDRWLRRCPALLVVG